MVAINDFSTLPKKSHFGIGNMMEKKDPAETSVDILAGDAEVQGYDEHATKKLLRKLDWNIIPFMSLIYL